jgi:hypothetical protein
MDPNSLPVRESPIGAWAALFERKLFEAITRDLKID